MRKLWATFVALAAVLLLSSLTWKAEAQTLRGATIFHTQTQNFTPIEKAACGPFFGRRCGPFHHWVCGPYGRRCWCAPC